MPQFHASLLTGIALAIVCYTIARAIPVFKEQDGNPVAVGGLGECEEHAACARFGFCRL